MVGDSALDDGNGIDGLGRSDGDGSAPVARLCARRAPQASGKRDPDVIELGHGALEVGSYLCITRIDEVASVEIIEGLLHRRAESPDPTRLL
jgi:hypothetical protein